MKNIDKLQSLYDTGYKCIRYEDCPTGEFKMYFKNFEEEKIDEISSTNTNEINQLKSYVDNH